VEGTKRSANEPCLAAAVVAIAADCAPGYGTKPGFNGCVRAARGEYAPGGLLGSTEARIMPCPQGSTTQQVASTDVMQCDICLPGWGTPINSADTSVCVIAVAGQYAAGGLKGAEGTRLKTCPTGTTTTIYSGPGSTNVANDGSGKTALTDCNGKFFGQHHPFAMASHGVLVMVYSINLMCNYNLYYNNQSS
jgi:hypothetical protein